jgi:hypothetical protein
MSEVDLSRLNAKSFERLVRSLAFHVLGPAGIVFSAGADAGRDFSYEGAIKGYEGKSWNGYLVIQAKFRETLRGPSDDAAWLEAQINSELREFKSSAGRRKPQYYIVATNVALSGSDGITRSGRRRVGGVSRIEASLAKWKSSIGLSDFDIWPADKIVDLVALAPEIKQSFSAWLTAGDFYERALRLLQGTKADFSSVIRTALKNSLRKDQFARLKDAGSVTDDSIRVSQVFVDLPLEKESAYRDEIHNSTPSENCVVSRLVERSREKLDPEALATNARPIAKPTSLPSRNAIVLLGGPGQGKSTVGLFVTQLFRAAALIDDPTAKRDPNLKIVVPETLRRATTERIGTMFPLRYPVHISLPRFADAISKAKAEDKSVPSVLMQICTDLSRVSDSKVTRDDLRLWLKHYAWLVIFDGLDEVPQSGERSAVLEAIAEFLTLTVDLNADVLLLVTTRPQGYNRDLDANHWEHWHLADLSPERALAYAHSLGIARYPDDTERREEIAAMLQQATQKPATSRLMVSPLQVTIMHMIVDTGGGVPAARWSLFADYFEILKKREKAKGGETQKILERNLSHLGPIHHRAGLILQADSEIAGSAGSALDHKRFRSLLRSYLDKQGFSGVDLTKRVDELMKVALERLVLLSTREEGTISFDVRSLQEFMAAAALTSDGPAAIDARLNHLAGLSHWEHVVLIAASRCFAEDAFHHCRANVVNVARLVETEATQMLVRTGASLALDLFADGIGIDHPGYRRQLATHALELLEKGPVDFEVPLALLWEPATEDLVGTVVTQRLGEGGTAAALAAWQILFEISSRGSADATTLLERNWPGKLENASEICEQARLPLDSPSIVHKIESVLKVVGPARASRIVQMITRNGFRYRSFNESYVSLARLSLQHLMEPFRIEIGLLGSLRDSPISLGLIRVAHREKQKLHLPQGLSEAWTPVIQSAHFQADPGPKTLSSALTAIAKTGTLNEAKQLSKSMPWPIASAVHIASSDGALEDLARRAADGKLGDAEDWAAAETRWSATGISKKDFLEADREISKKIRSTGAPSLDLSTVMSLSGRHNTKFAVQLSELAMAVGIERRRQLIHYSAMALSNVPSTDLRLSPDTLIKLLKVYESCSEEFYYCPIASFMEEAAWKNNEVVETITRLAPFMRFGDGDSNHINLAAEAFTEDPKRRGLLCFMVSYAGRRAKQFDDVLLTLNKTAYVHEASDRPTVGIAVSILRLAKGFPATDEMTKILDCLFELQDPWRGVTMIADSIELPEIPLDARIAVAAELVKKIDILKEKSSRKRQLVPYARSVLERVLNRRDSGLTDKSIWVDRLGLPAEVFDCLRHRSTSNSAPA